MALVFPHEGPYVNTMEYLIIGKFLGDGLEYLACIRDKRFIDFYQFPECYIKCKTIEVFEKDSGYSIHRTELYNMSPTLDYVVIGYSKNGVYETFCKYWNTTEVVDLAGNSRDNRFPGRNVAPGLFVHKRNQVCKENEVVFSREMSDESNLSICLLDEDTIAIFDEVEGEDGYQLEIFSLKLNRILSKWTSGLDFLDCWPTASYVSKGDKSKILVSYGLDRGDDYVYEKFFTLDISQLEAQVIQYSANEECVSQGTIPLFYDDATGVTVFKSFKPYAYCWENPVLIIFRNGNFSKLSYERGELKGNFIFRDCGVYEILVNSDGELQLEYRTSLPAMNNVEHTYRDLAGTVYLDVNGVFRESLAFVTSGVLSSDFVEPVTNVFWVGNGSVLISGKANSVVVDTHTAKEIDSWYRPQETLFASENFQVYKAQGKSWLCTKDKGIELPFADACLFASSDDSIVVGSTTKVAIIEPNLEVNQTIEDDSIVGVFSEGYACKSGVKFFKTPERNVQAGGLVSAQHVNDVLFTVSINGELRNGANQEAVDLMLEGVDFINTFNDKLLISGANDTYIYSKGDYTSMEAGDYESILVSDDNLVCITLLQGIVYLKINAGFRMLKKKIDGTLGYGSVSVCNDKLMCRQVKFSSSEDKVIVKDIAKEVTHEFRIPCEPLGQTYVLFSDIHFVRAEQGKPTVYSLSNPEISDEILSCEDFYARTLPSLISNNKLYTEWVASYSQVFESVNGELRRGAEYEKDSRHHILSLEPSHYPRSGNHWIFVCEAGNDQWKIHLIPKSQESVKVGIGGYLGFNSIICHWFSAIQSENDADVYYCASDKEVYKVSVDGTQERIAKIKANTYAPSSTKYTVNHGLKIEYEPDFIITIEGHPITITILPPSEAEKLQAIQKELIGDSKDADVVSEIDGKFLLSAAMDSKNEYFFAKHGIDIDELRKDLFELFK